MMKRKDFDITTIMPIVIFVIIVIIFSILTGGQVLTPKNLSNILAQSIPYFICGLGMLFVAAIGGTDITCGSLVGLAGTFAAMAGTGIGVWAMFPVAIGVGFAVGLINGVFVAKLKIPSFMMTLAMLIALRACVSWMLNANNVLATKNMRVFDQMGIKIVILLVLIVIFGYIFRFTPFGTYLRAIGENEQAFSYTGVNLDRVKIAAFVISGALAGLAGVFVMLRNGGANNTMGNSMEMRVMLCLFLAGIPVQGGSGTRLYKMLIGVLTYFVLDNGLTLMGGSSIVNQLIRGIVLIFALYLTRLVGDVQIRRDTRQALEEEALQMEAKGEA